jgi:hypothetical protein
MIITKMPMGEFEVVYWPGGMSLDVSAWWLCKQVLIDGIPSLIKIKKLKNA